MPERTTEESVKALCPTRLTDLSGPMRMGSLQVDRVYGDVIDELTELLERAAVAYYIALLDPREQSASSSVGNLRVTYEGRHKDGGKNTYLDMVAQLDSTGQMVKNMTSSKRPTFLVV